VGSHHYGLLWAYREEIKCLLIDFWVRLFQSNQKFSRAERHVAGGRHSPLSPAEAAMKVKYEMATSGKDRVGVE
jgi:hypothetical protein